MPIVLIKIITSKFKTELRFENIEFFSPEVILPSFDWCSTFISVSKPLKKL